MDLEQLLPVFHFRTRYARRIAADPDTTWRAYQELTVEELPTTRMLLQVRALGRLRISGPMVKVLPLPVLSSGENQEVRGRVGQFWLPSPRYALISRRDLTGFRDFARPGWAKAALNMRVEPADGGSELIAETRVRCTSRWARVAFAVYWSFVRFGGGVIQKEMLRAIARRAERVESV